MFIIPDKFILLTKSNISPSRAPTILPPLVKNLIIIPINTKIISNNPCKITNTLADITFDIKWIFGLTLEIIISILLVVFSSFTSAPIICTKNIININKGNVITCIAVEIIILSSWLSSLSVIFSTITFLLISSYISSVILYSSSTISLRIAVSVVLISVLVIVPIFSLLTNLALM